MPRAASPAPQRSVSPQPQMSGDGRHAGYRSASPNPYSGHHRNSSQMSMSQKRGSDQGYHRQSSPNDAARSVSPAPFRDYNRPQSSYGGNDMAVQLAPAGEDHYGSQRGRGSGRPDSRAMGLYDGGSRQRSKSVADPARQYTRDGRAILHFGKPLSYIIVRRNKELTVTQHVRCTCTRPPFQKSWALPREIISLYYAIKTMVGGRPRCTEETDASGWSQATICNRARRFGGYMGYEDFSLQAGIWCTFVFPYLICWQCIYVCHDRSFWRWLLFN